MLKVMSLKVFEFDFEFGQFDFKDYVINCKELYNEKWFEFYNKVMVFVSINVIFIFR